MVNVRRIVAGLLVVGVAVALAGCQGAEIDKLRGANQIMRAQLDKTLKDLDKMRAERDAALARVDELDRKVLIAQKERDLWKEKYNALAETQEKLKTIPAELEQRLREIVESIGGTYLGKGAMRFPADILFDPGKTTVKPKAKEAIKQVAQAFNEKGEGFILRIDGHTDEQPIKVSPWADNWELGAERARAVLKVLRGEGVAPERMFIASYSMYRPVDPGHKEDSWKKNRRVEISLIPALPKTPAEEAAP